MLPGTANGMNMEQPRQILRSGGNVLSTFLFDENEDGEQEDEAVFFRISN